MSKKKAAAPTPVPLKEPVFASTYSLITAERILDRLEIEIPQSRLKGQILDKNAFYHRLMYLPARRLQTGITNQQCRDVQAYAQQKLIHYLFSGETARSEEEDGHDMRQSIEENRLSLVSMGDELTAWEEQDKSLEAANYDALTEKVNAWRETVMQVCNEAQGHLEQQGVDIDEDFFDKFYIHIDDLAAGIKIKEDVARLLKLGDKVGIVMRVVVHLLVKDIEHPGLTKKQCKELKDPFLALDSALIMILDDLGGFNQEQDQALKNSQEQLEYLMQRFEAHAILVARQLFDYYLAYGLDKEAKVTGEEAVRYGIDDIVYDQYTMLRKR